MIKNEINLIINNLKFNIAIFKINLDAIKVIFILNIDNKHAKSMPILQSLFKISVHNINIPIYSFS